MPAVRAAPSPLQGFGSRAEHTAGERGFPPTSKGAIVTGTWPGGGRLPARSGACSELSSWTLSGKKRQGSRFTISNSSRICVGKGREGLEPGRQTQQGQAAGVGGKARPAGQRRRSPPCPARPAACACPEPRLWRERRRRRAGAARPTRTAAPSRPWESRAPPAPSAKAAACESGEPATSDARRSPGPRRAGTTRSATHSDTPSPLCSPIAPPRHCHP